MDGSRFDAWTRRRFGLAAAALAQRIREWIEKAEARGRGA